MVSFPAARQADAPAALEVLVAREIVVIGVADYVLEDLLDGSRAIDQDRGPTTAPPRSS